MTFVSFWLPITTEGYTSVDSSKFQEKQREKVEKKIAGSYVTASWELAGAQESCSINLRKLGQCYMLLRRVCSSPCWQRQEQPSGVSWLHPCLPTGGWTRNSRGYLRPLGRVSVAENVAEGKWKLTHTRNGKTIVFIKYKEGCGQKKMYEDRKE